MSGGLPRASAEYRLTEKQRVGRLRADASLEGLAPRTIEVARLTASGFVAKEVGHLLGVQRSVIARERQRFMQATGCMCLRDLILACRRFGLELV